jgi:hypothetical protein
MGRTLSSDSANVIALPASPTGFTAGDYVYQTTSGYGSVPTGALATGNFDTGALPASVYSSTATTSNELTYVEQLGGSQGSQVAAQLVNGNLVYAYATGDTTTYAGLATVNFKIETQAGAVVVAQTSTTMTVQGPFNVSVIALPAGGFCIVSTLANGTSAYNLNARFYNADGTAATGVLNVSPNITSSSVVSRLVIRALTDGSVIVGYINSTTFELRKLTTAGFDATFGTSGVTTVLAWNSNSQWWDFVTDSSNNIHTISTTGTGSATLRRYNSSGVQQTTSTVSSLTGVNALDIAISSSGTIRGFVQDSTGIAIITWDGTTAALGTRIITETLPVSGVFGAFAQGASDGYVVFYNATIPTTAAVGLYFRAFDSSNVALAAATRVNSVIAVNYRNQLTPIVISGNTRVYFGVFQTNTASYSLNAAVVPMGVAYFTYSNTTYSLVGAPTTNYNYGEIGPLALGAYVRGASTAAIAKFTIATTGTYSKNYTAGSTLIAKTFVDGSNTSYKLLLAPLPDGKFVAAWARSSGTYQTFISKYSATGELLAGPIAVSTAGNSTSAYAVSVATFANGNILVTYTDSTFGATVLLYRIYTSSLTLVTSGTLDNAVITSSNTMTTSSASFGDGGHVAVLFLDSSQYPTTRAVSDSGTVTARLAQLTTTTNWYQTQVVGLKSNAYIISAQNPDGSQTCVGSTIRKTGPTTFLASAQWTNNGMAGTSSAVASSPIPCPGTTAYVVGVNTSNNSFRLINVNPLVNSQNNILNRQNFANPSAFGGLSIGSSYGASIGYTPTGVPVMVGQRAATQFITLSPFSAPTDGASDIATTGSITTTLDSSNGSLAPSVIPHIAEAVLIGYIDSNVYPAFTSIVVLPFTVSTVLTTGVDTSTTGLSLLPQNGYSLQGISLTAAASGSSGLVQTRGTATLNSNYSAATPSTNFDFRNPTTFGTSGTVVGRTVIMGNN